MPDLRIFSARRRSVAITDDVVFGGGLEPVMIAGPCAIEDYDTVLTIGAAVQQSGARILRGGAFKPRTSPWSFEGLGLEGLQILAAVGKALAMPVITEIMDAHDLEAVCDYADVLQIGTRNMQNFTLLHEIGKTSKPVMLKRGMCATYDEWAFAAEHIAKYGNEQIILCERGIRTFEQHTRNTLDLAAVPVMQAMTGLPVVVDPSHATGRPELIAPLARAAAAVGCDGIMIEVHDDPQHAKCDGGQAFLPAQYDLLCREISAFGYVGEAA